jgi:hypothetical protein
LIKKSAVYHGITIRKTRTGYAILWPTERTSFTTTWDAAKALVRDRLKRGMKI